MKHLKHSRKKTLVIYYSYTGETKKLAVEAAKKRSAALCEIKDLKRPNRLKAYTIGTFLAMRHRPSKIDVFGADFTYYDKLVLFAPIWAGNPAPPLNQLLQLLPPGKEVEINLVSGGGSSNCKAYLIDCIREKECRLTKYRDIKKP